MSALSVPPWTPPKVLVVEDNNDLNFLISDILHDEGYSCHSALNVKQSIEWILDNPDCVALLDYNLPDGTAEQLVNILADNDIKIPFVVMTGHGDEKIAVRMMKLGAMDYIIKDDSLIDILPYVVTQTMDRLKVETQLDMTRKFLRTALDESVQRNREMSSLLDCARSVMDKTDFRTTARYIYGTCRKLLGCSGGYVALLSEDGMENEVLFLDSGESECIVDESLPMPVRGLRADAYSTGNCVFENEFQNSEWVEFLPEGHIGLDNVMFAPLNIEGKTIGIMGFSNKVNGFTEGDALLVSAFADLAAVSLQNSWNIEKLQKSEEKYRNLIEFANDAIFVIDPETRKFIEVNDLAVSRTGYSREELLSMGIDSLASPRSILNNKTIVRDLLKNGSIIFEHIHQRKDGSEYPVEISSKVIEHEDRKVFLSLVRDITERKKAAKEIEIARMELENKNQELETFVYAAAHDLKNPLIGAQGLTRLLERTAGSQLNEDQLYLIRRAIANLDYLDQLLSDLLEFSRVATGETGKEAVNIVSLVKRIESDQKEMIRKNKAVILLEAEPPFLLMSQTGAYQIFSNLITNSLQFTREGISPKIEIGVTSPAELEIPEGHLLFHIRDNGTGIDKMWHDKVFGLFIRVDKSRSDGSGAGLAIVKRIIEQNDGRIWIESSPGEGSTFYFTLPVVEESRGSEAKRPSLQKNSTPKNAKRSSGKKP